MKHSISILALLPSLLFATIWNGTADTTWYNESETEFTITTAEQLAGLARLGSMSSKTIKLGNDIALNDTAGWKNWNEETTGLTQWTAIGRFQGTFDGDGHVISGVYINSESNNQGLFGSNDGTIKNLGVIASYIKGRWEVGGLAGANNGTISNSYATGNVAGTFIVGGLAGANNGTISNSYATGNVAGTDYVGGLVGSGGNIINGYYDRETSGQNNTKGIPKTTEYMKSEEFVETLQLGARILLANEWIYSEGEYPKLSNTIAGSMDYDYLKGEGTEENSYIIETKEQLETFSLVVNLIEMSYSGKYLKLGNDIALNDTAGWKNWNEETTGLTQWTAIGRFQGTFDGDGHVISGVYINSESDYQGLFGLNEGLIKNLGVAASYIKGGRYVGGLAGFNHGGTIINSYATGNVEGIRSDVGGLVGENQGTVGMVTGGAVIINSYATGNVSVSGTEYSTSVGGLAGSNYHFCTIINSYATGNVSGVVNVGGLTGSNQGFISNSYATGNVEGSEVVGGLVAENGYNGTITNSYATGNVEGTDRVGGLVGSNSNGGITNSYYKTETSNQSDTDKGYGRTTAQMQNKNNYVGWDFNETWYIDGIFNNRTPYFQWQNTMRQVQVEPIEPQLYTGSQITPTPKVTAPDGTELIPGIDFDYYYGENIHVATGGIVYIASKTDAYYGSKTVTFVIKTLKTVDIYWWPECGAVYTYNGKPQGPTPYAVDYEVTAELETNAATGITAVAELDIQEEDVVLQNASCSYTISPKTLEVIWTADSVFTYNKMIQAPMPSVSDTSVKILRSNIQSAAGTYKDGDAALAEIEDQEQARNYTLTNRTKNYEILKKGLNPYFAATLPDFSTNKADTLWVPYEVFKDSAALHSVLSGLIDYNGFATDTIKNESDNATVLKGKPTIALRYTQTSPSILSKRVETTQKATATIVTDSVSADNYTLTRPAIVIMATIEENENADKVFCRLGSNCAGFSAEVCSAISGQIVESCDFKVACVINGTCIKDFPFETCSAMKGEAFSSCEEVPILRPVLSGGTFRIWQTASGVVNVDLGYMPSTPGKLQIYDLKGNLIATEQLNTRFANVKVNVSSGVYLFKAGNKILKAAVL